jgi:starch synthase
VKTVYNDDPTFAETKVVTSVYNFGFSAELNSKMIDKVKFDGISDDTLNLIQSPTLDNLTKLAVSYSDGVILGSEVLAEDVTNHIEGLNIPVLPFIDIDVFAEAYNNFYHNEVLGED